MVEYDAVSVTRSLRLKEVQPYVQDTTISVKGYCIALRYDCVDIQLHQCVVQNWFTGNVVYPRIIVVVILTILVPGCL